MPNQRIITIDGGNGVGKTTLVHDLRELYNGRRHAVLCLTGGNIYRVFALLAYEGAKGSIEQAAKTPAESCLELARVGQLEFREGIIYLHGQQVPDDVLRTEEITRLTPILARLVPLRRFIDLELLQPAGHQFDGYVLGDGRDMATVFPDAPVKLFLTVDDVEAARRQGHSLEMVQQRNRHDRERKVGALVPATDAHIIDTTYTTTAEKLALVDAIITKVFPELARSRPKRV